MLSNVEPMVPEITEDSNMTRPLCVRLDDFGDSLERSVMISLSFMSDGFATEGNTHDIIPGIL